MSVPEVEEARALEKRRKIPKGIIIRKISICGQPWFLSHLGKSGLSLRSFPVLLSFFQFLYIDHFALSTSMCKIWEHFPSAGMRRSVFTRWGRRHSQENCDGSASCI